MSPQKSLEPFLTIHQAVAWVQYRTIEAVAAARTAEGLAAFRLSDPELKGTRSDLRRALSEGSLVANGKTDDGVWRDIPAREWVDLPVAPLTPERQWPYLKITIGRDALKKRFPGEQSGKPRGAPPKYDWAWVRAEAAKEPPQTQGSLAEVLIARFQEVHGKRIGLSTMKRKLGEWGYGSIS